MHKIIHRDFARRTESGGGTGDISSDYYSVIYFEGRVHSFARYCGVTRKPQTEREPGTFLDVLSDWTAFPRTRGPFASRLLWLTVKMPSNPPTIANLHPLPRRN